MVVYVIVVKEFYIKILYIVFIFSILIKLVYFISRGRYE